MATNRRTVWVLLLLLPLWLPGFLAAVWRCTFRVVAENQDRFVETVVDFEELRRLSRDEGWSLGDMLEEVKKRGASSVGLSEDTLASLESEGRISLLTYQEVQKLSLEAFVATPTPPIAESPGTLWVHSPDEGLLDRIQQHLSWKLPENRLHRLQRNMLLVRKSSLDFRERVGLGFSREFLLLAESKGMGVVLRLFNYPGLPAESVRSIILDLPEPASASALLFSEEEILGSRGALETAVGELFARGYRVGLVEFNDQEGMPQLLARIQGKRPIVRVHSISRRELDELYTAPRAVARFVRAVRERRLKMLYVRCFQQDRKKFIGDLVQFNLGYLSEIVKSLGSWGFAIARFDHERRQEPRHLVGTLSAGERLAIGLSLLLGIPLLIGAMRDRQVRATELFLTVLVGAIGIVFLKTDQFNVLAGLAGAIAYSTVGCIWSIARLQSEPEPRSMRGWIGSGFRFLLRLAVPGFLGGTLIAGLYAEVPYLLRFEQFRGIKAAFLVPLVIILYWSLRRFGGGIFSLFSRPLSVREGGIIAIVLAGSMLYLLRSGNVTFLKPSELEDLGRTFLENTLGARPRNKEFLIGYPAAIFFLFFYWRRAWEILPALALFLQMGQVSVVNTFCHFHSPLLLAYLRGANGFWLGILVGLGALACYVLLAVLTALGSKDRTVFLVGYFGFGNLGDEILWREFIKEGRRTRPELRWAVLHQTGSADSVPPETTLIERGSWVAILEQLASARAVVVPGGGVLQAATSLRSLLYYFSILVIGRLAGARLLLPAQGLGPWQKPEVDASGLGVFPGFFAQMLVRTLVDSADYLTVRDQASLEQVQRLPGPPRQPACTADLAFLLETSGVAREPGDKLHLGVILRGASPAAPALARRLLEMSERLENLIVHPLVLQPEEDAAAWKGTALEDSVRVLPDAPAAFAAFQEVDAVLSMRLHGCLLSTIAGVPWIGIEIDPKIGGLARECGWEFLLSPAEVREGDALTLSLNKLMLSHQDNRSRLAGLAETKRRVAEGDVAACLGRIAGGRW